VCFVVSACDGAYIMSVRVWYVQATPSWSILKDDYLMGAKMTDWDKQEESESEDSEPDVAD